MGEADEHRSERIRLMRERGAQEATLQMGCIDAKDPSRILDRASQTIKIVG